MARRRQEKMPLRGRIARAFSFPADAIGGVSRVSVIGHSEVMIEGCYSVASYECERVVLRTHDTVAVVIGKDLNMRTFASGVITLTGKIERLEFGGTDDV